MFLQLILVTNYIFLIKYFQKCFQKFSIISEDERFGAFIKYLHQSYMGKNYSVQENMSTLSINTIDHVSILSS